MFLSFVFLLIHIVGNSNETYKKKKKCNIKAKLIRLSKLENSLFLSNFQIP
jgi:hypothetical protein